MNGSTKSLRSWEELERFLKANPDAYVFETTDPERRYFAGRPGDNYGLSVDGRSLRALRHRMKKHDHGGLQLAA